LKLTVRLSVATLYCYNEEQQILDHMTIIGEAYVEKISSL